VGHQYISAMEWMVREIPGYPATTAVCAHVSSRSLIPVGMYVDALGRTVQGNWLPLQSLADVHIYVPDRRSYNAGGWEAGPPAFR
jgi:hypothetical protein